jgi:hypothetical protein
MPHSKGSGGHALDPLPCREDSPTSPHVDLGKGPITEALLMNRRHQRIEQLFQARFEGSLEDQSGGLLFGWLAKEQKHSLLLAAEGAGDTLALLTWVVFGAGVVGQAAGGFSWAAHRCSGFFMFQLLILTFDKCALNHRYSQFFLLRFNVLQIFY